MTSRLRSCATHATALALLSWAAFGCSPRPGANEDAKTAAESQPPAAPAAPPPSALAPAPAEPPKQEKLPSEILSGPDKAWVFSFEASAGYEKAKADCDEHFASDPKGRARCISKARDAFTADAMEFKRDDAGNDVWVIYHTQSKKLVQVYSVQIEYGEQGPDTVQIKKLGHEKGKPLLFAGVPDFKVKLGGEYSLELQDEKHGLLSYDARLGFITTQ
jgi:hypothetical protein